MFSTDVGPTMFIGVLLFFVITSSFVANWCPCKKVADLLLYRLHVLNTNHRLDANMSTIDQRSGRLLPMEVFSANSIV